MKLTKSKLKQIIKEELSNVLRESMGGFDWPFVDELMSEEHPDGGPAYDLEGLLEKIGSTIRDFYGFDTRKYDMDSMDLAVDVIQNYEDELKAVYPDIDLETAAEILDSYIRG